MAPDPSPDALVTMHHGGYGAGHGTFEPLGAVASGSQNAYSSAAAATTTSTRVPSRTPHSRIAPAAASTT